MAWIRIHDQFPQHPKVLSVGPLGMAMQVAALCYCNRLLTDGFVPFAAARTLLDWQFAGEEEDDGRRKLYSIGVSCGMRGDDVEADFVIGLLTDAGIWEPADGGYQIHDYKDYQTSKDEITTVNEAQVAAGKARATSANRINGRFAPTSSSPAETQNDHQQANQQNEHENQLPTSYPPAPPPADHQPNKEVRSKKEEVDIGNSDPNGCMSVSEKSDPLAETISEIFNHYRTKVQPRARFLPEARDKIRARLKSYTADDLKIGIDNFSGDSWQMDNNGNRGAPWFFHSDKRSEQYLNLEPRKEQAQNGQHRSSPTNGVTDGKYARLIAEAKARAQAN